MRCLLFFFPPLGRSDFWTTEGETRIMVKTRWRLHEVVQKFVSKSINVQGIVGCQTTREAGHWHKKRITKCLLMPAPTDLQRAGNGEGDVCRHSTWHCGLLVFTAGTNAGFLSWSCACLTRPSITDLCPKLTWIPHTPLTWLPPLLLL